MAVIYYVTLNKYKIIIPLEDLEKYFGDPIGIEGFR